MRVVKQNLAKKFSGDLEEVISENGATIRFEVGGGVSFEVSCSEGDKSITIKKVQNFDDDSIGIFDYQIKVLPTYSNKLKVE